MKSVQHQLTDNEKSELINELICKANNCTKVQLWRNPAYREQKALTMFHLNIYTNLPHKEIKSTQTLHNILNQNQVIDSIRAIMETPLSFTALSYRK